MVISSVGAAMLSRCLSSSRLNALKVGDILSQSRVFTSKDLREYSKASHDSNPLHFDSDFARNSGFDDSLAHGMLIASIFAAHFWLLRRATFFPKGKILHAALQKWRRFARSRR